MVYWHSAQGGKEIYQIQVPVTAKKNIPDHWVKQSGTAVSQTKHLSIQADSQKLIRYYNSETKELIRAYQEAKETESAAKKAFYKHLLSEFDKDRAEWLKAVK